MTDSIDSNFLNACPNLKLIACALKGYDNFDIQACSARGVAVTAVPDLLTAPTAELAILLALGLGRRIREADHIVRSGRFRGWRPIFYGSGLADAVVGIYGFGDVGRAVAERVKGFAPSRILSYELNADASSTRNLDDLLESCDVLFVCTPLNPSTYHSINKESLAKIKPGLQLINISR